jgi:mono/diheme cytochrome c family protein
MRWHFVLIVALLIGPAPAAWGQAGDPRLGQTFAERNCAACHAIGRSGESRVPAAPAFRRLHLRYPVEQLAEALAEGITTGHTLMPEFQLSPVQIEDLLAYLKTLER